MISPQPKDYHGDDPVGAESVRVQLLLWERRIIRRDDHWFAPHEIADALGLPRDGILLVGAIDEAMASQEIEEDGGRYRHVS